MSVEDSEKSIFKQSHQYSKELQPVVFIDKKSTITDLVNDSKLSGYVHEKWSLPLSRQTAVHCPCSIPDCDIVQAELDTQLRACDTANVRSVGQSDMVMMDDYEPVGVYQQESERRVSFNLQV